jgi:hypothetical protein
MSTTTITTDDHPETFDHEVDGPSFTQTAPHTSSDDRDRMLDYIIAESREQRAREHRRDEQAAATRRRRTRGALATGTVAIVIAVGGTLFFIDGPSHGTGSQSSGGTQAAPIQPASNGSQTVPASGASSSSVPASSVTPAAANITPATPPPGPSANNTGNMGSNGGPLNGSVSH